MKHIHRFSFSLLLFLIIGTTFSQAQFKFGSDIYSRYIWRGVDYGNAPSFQPGISYTISGFSVGTWAAYSVGESAPGSVFAEHDLWASYGLETDFATISLYYTDYFYPSAGLKYFDFKDGGSHVLEAGLGYVGRESFPISVTVYANFFNDVDNSIYVYAGYPFAVDETTTLTVFAGATPTKSAWYAATDAALINIGFTASKAIKFSETFSLPVSASFIVNPHIEQSYLIFGFSL